MKTWKFVTGLARLRRPPGCRATPFASLLLSLLLFFSAAMFQPAYGAGLSAPDEGRPVYVVARGERPPVEFSKASPDAFVPGVLLVKFREEFGKHLDNGFPVRDKNDRVSFKQDELDKMNARFGLRNASHHFFDPQVKTVFSDRHRAWGFHLWYRLEFEPQVDLAEMAARYRELQQVELAEPQLKRVHAGSKLPEMPAMQPGSASRHSEKTEWWPNDTYFRKQWSLNNTGQSGGLSGADIDMPKAWAMERGNPGVIVAIIDSGVDHTHPDLAPNMWEGIGYNFVDDRETIVPDNHGTQSAGIVAAATNNNIGVSGIAGGDDAGNGVRLMTAQIYRPDYSSGGEHLALVWAADNGAAIAQNSWSHGVAFAYNQDVLDAIDYFNVNGGGDSMAGGLVIFSAGNEASAAPHFPAAYSGAIAVAATDHKDRKTSYSNYGVWVDITAPGGELYEPYEQGIYTTRVNGDYGFFLGTSAAAPHVSGVAALLVSNAYGLLKASLVRDLLLISAQDNLYANPGFQGDLGRGKLNAGKALIELRQSMEGVFSPGGFSAVSEHPESILLKWEPNMDNDGVLVALLPESFTGSPEAGAVYSVGDVIPDGGTVIYHGKSDHFLLENLEAGNKYRFGIWSVNEAMVYSSGRYAKEVTLSCEPGTECIYQFAFTGMGWIWGGNYIRVSQNGRTVEKLSHYCGTSASSQPVPLCHGVPFEIELKSSYAYMTVELEIFGPAGNSVYRGILDGDNLDTLLYAGLADCAPVICQMPEEILVGAVSQQTAEISWKPGDDISAWRIEWGLEGFKRGSGSMADGITGERFQIDGLSPSTRYDFYVQAVCQADGDSHWSRREQFATECLDTGLPYFENFDSEPEYKIPPCWAKSGKGTWFVDLTKRGVFTSSPPKSMRLFHQSNSYAVAVLPDFGVPVNELVLRFYPDGINPRLYVGTISDPADSESFTTYKTITLEDTYGVPYPLVFEISFAEYEGTDTRIAFRMGHEGIPMFGQVNIDDLEVRWAMDPTNIRELADQVSLRVFPVPAGTHMVVQSDGLIKTLRLVNAKGQAMMLTEVNDHSKHLDVSGLPVGIYYLQVLTDEGYAARAVSIVR
jgi:hypothetical protein